MRYRISIRKISLAVTGRGALASFQFVFRREVRRFVGVETSSGLSNMMPWWCAQLAMLTASPLPLANSARVMSVHNTARTPCLRPHC